MRNSPLKAFASGDKKKIKKDKQEIKRTKYIDDHIEKGNAPKPNTKKKLNQYLDYIHDRKIV